LIIIFVIAVALAFLVVGLGMAFGPRRPTQRKAAPYESGMVPYGQGRRRISVRYYLIAVLFILFDVETIFLIPWAVVLKELGIPGLIEMILFVVILMVGFIYAWKKGALEWE
ncbi:MAG TPA: NADH-quinone oxidoreductase subunit A, partial [Anaerolineaceae bacterium]|nr:NADH-quinone oxidoreductase subunit A [Anaerolineaceae bacterium]